MTGILGILIIALIIWIIFQLSTASEYVADIRGNETAEDNSNKFNAIMSLVS